MTNKKPVLPVHPEQGPVLGHVPHKQLAVGQPVLGDDPGHHDVLVIIDQSEDSI